LKKIVLIVLNNFVNDIRVYKECKSLSLAGYDAIVVSLHDNNLNEFETINGIKVHRIKLKTRKWSKHKPIQFIKYIEFIIKFIKIYKNYDIFHCNDLNTLPIGVLIKKYFNKNAKILYDAHEYEIERSGNSKYEKKILKIIENKLIKYANKIITVSESIANEYVNLYKIDKPLIIYNAPNYVNITKTNILREIFGINNNQKIFLFQGGLSKGRGIELILNSFIQIYEKSEEYNNLPVVIFIGDGFYKDKIIELASRYKNIYYCKPVSPFELLNYSSSADFGLCLYENINLNHFYALPNKIFEYMMAEIPIIASNLYEISQFIEKNGLGIIIEPNTFNLIQAVFKIINFEESEFKEKIKKAKCVFNWENQEKIFTQIYKEL